MKYRQRRPSHPGGILRRRYLEPLGVSNTELARAIGVARKTVSKLTNEHSGVSPEMAVSLSLALGTTPEFWLNLQQNYDLWTAQNSRDDWDSIKPLRRESSPTAS